MEVYLQKQEELIALERNEEIERHQAYQEKSLKILEINGVAVRKLIADSIRTTGFGRRIVTFTVTSDKFVGNISSGDIVRIEQGNRTEVSNGVVSSGGLLFGTFLERENQKCFSQIQSRKAPHLEAPAQPSKWP